MRVMCIHADEFAAVDSSIITQLKLQLPNEGSVYTVNRQYVEDGRVFYELEGYSFNDSGDTTPTQIVPLFAADCFVLLQE